MDCLTICQAPSGAARSGSDLAAKAKAGGWYPVLVIGGVLVLLAIFIVLAKMRRD
jgi:hypothetical protein